MIGGGVGEYDTAVSYGMTTDRVVSCCMIRMIRVLSTPIVTHIICMYPLHLYTRIYMHAIGVSDAA